MYLHSCPNCGGMIREFECPGCGAPWSRYNRFYSRLEDRFDLPVTDDEEEEDNQ